MESWFEFRTESYQRATPLTLQTGIFHWSDTNQARVDLSEQRKWQTVIAAMTGRFLMMGTPIRLSVVPVCAGCESPLFPSIWSIVSTLIQNILSVLSSWKSNNMNCLEWMLEASCSSALHPCWKCSNLEGKVERNETRSWCLWQDVHTQWHLIHTNCEIKRWKGCGFSLQFGSQIQVFSIEHWRVS